MIIRDRKEELTLDDLIKAKQIRYRDNYIETLSYEKKEDNKLDTIIVLYPSNDKNLATIRNFILDVNQA